MMSQGHNYTAAAQSKSSFQGPTRPSNKSEEAFYNMQALSCLLLPSLAAETQAENLSPKVFFQASSEFGDRVDKTVSSCPEMVSHILSAGGWISEK